MRAHTWGHTGTRASTHLHLVLLLLEGEEAEDDGPDEHAQEADQKEVLGRRRILRLQRLGVGKPRQHLGRHPATPARTPQPALVTLPP